jgi:hypothetical protein
VRSEHDDLFENTHRVLGERVGYPRVIAPEHPQQVESGTVVLPMQRDADKKRGYFL